MDILSKIVSRIFLIFCVGFFTLAEAELHQNNAFLYANHLVAGVGPDGAFGTNVVAPSGPFAGSKIGYSSDPNFAAFAGEFDGDFFLPGFPEEGWAITINGTTYNNNSNIQGPEVDGLLSNFKSENRFSSVDWSGSVDGLEILQTYRTFTKGLAIIMHVELKNTTSTKMNDVYFMRTVDPDNNAENRLNPTNNFATNNSIVQQGDKGSAAVKATQGSSIVTLSGYTSRSRVAHGGQFVRNPESVYNGTNGQNKSGSKNADESISVAVKFDEINPGEKVRFTLSYALAHITPPVVLLDTDNSSGLTNGDFRSVYPLGESGVPITDIDLTINSSTADMLEAMRVSILNPLPGDMLIISSNLPSGITLDGDEENGDSIINLKGNVSQDIYAEVLKSIRYVNKDPNANLSTREIVVQAFDDISSLSNSSEARIFITVPIKIETPISTDDIVSSPDLMNTVSLKGTAAPNASLELTFTDTEGKITTKTGSVGPDGVWNIELNKADLDLLKDGLITVKAEAIDENGYDTTTNSEFTKDITVNVKIISPTDQEIINDEKIVVVGESDPNASIVVSTNGGLTCSVVADRFGNWTCTIEPVEEGESYPLTITAKDELGNELSVGQEVHISDLPLAVISPTNGGVADGETPLITGTTDPLIDITVTTESGDVCTTKSDANGNWSCHLAEMSIGGPHKVTIRAENPNNGEFSVIPWSFIVPDRPIIIESPEEDVLVEGVHPVIIKGTANPNTEIKVKGPNDEVCTTISDGDGKWSCGLTKIQTGNQQKITVCAVNADGSTKEITRLIDVKISDGQVETILNGGGNVSLILLLVIILLLVTRKKKYKVTY